MSHQFDTIQELQDWVAALKSENERLQAALRDQWIRANATGEDEADRIAAAKFVRSIAEAGR
jgi:uncharacterized coiled-coil protein SlyX